jgi:hypothetical protein
VQQSIGNYRILERIAADGQATVIAVSGKVMDDDGGSNEYTTTVTVNNVNPTATLGNNGPVDEASPATVSFTGQADPSTDDTGKLRYAYDCNGGSLAAATWAAGVTATSTDCTYDDDGSCTVSGKVMGWTTTVAPTSTPPRWWSTTSSLW